PRLSLDLPVSVISISTGVPAVRRGVDSAAGGGGVAAAAGCAAAPPACEISPASSKAASILLDVIIPPLLSIAARPISETCQGEAADDSAIVAAGVARGRRRPRPHRLHARDAAGGLGAAGGALRPV